MFFKRFYRGNLRNRILFNQLIFALIPFVIFMSFLIYNYRVSVIKSQKEELSSQLAITAQTMSSRITLYLNRSLLVVNNYYYLTILNEAVLGNYERMFEFKDLVSSLALELVPQQSRYAPFTFYIDGYHFEDSTYVEPMQNFPDPQLKTKVLDGASNGIVWGKDLHEDESGQLFLVFYRHISFFAKDAILRVKIPYNELKKILDQFWVNDHRVVVMQKNAYGQEVYFKDHSALTSSYMDFKPRNFLLFDSDILPDGSTVTIGIDKRYIWKKHVTNYAVVFLIFIIVLFLMIVASKMATTRITKSLHGFIDTISFDENQLLAIPLTSFNEYDEVNIIKARFAKVLREREAVHQNLLEVKNEYNLLEINLLQSRLNPHLLYNSLSTIRICAMGNDSRKTIAIVDALSDYYRLALNKGVDVTSVQHEIDLVTQYVNIIKLTYSKDYRLILSLDKDILRKPILKHLIQPIVENSLYHGLRGIRGEGVIEITGRRGERGTLVFQVMDNGLGMEEGTLHEVLNMEYTSPKGGFGIKNLMQKINLFYGEGCSITIENAKDQGVVVTITIKEISL